MTANRLRRVYSGAQADITVVDQDNRHIYQPGLLFVPFGLASADDIVRPRGRQLHRGIAYVNSAIDRVDLRTNQVTLENGTTIGYDVLVIATRAVLVPEETEGLTGAGWMDKVFTFYSLEGATALEGALATYQVSCPWRALVKAKQHAIAWSKDCENALGFPTLNWAFLQLRCSATRCEIGPDPT